METTVDKNKVIDEFMGVVHKQEFIQHKGEWRMSYSTYESNWNELMPVVNKIRSMYNSTEVYEHAAILIIDDIAEGCTEANILQTYNAVYEFITWYNKEKSGGNHAHK